MRDTSRMWNKTYTNSPKNDSKLCVIRQITYTSQTWQKICHAVSYFTSFLFIQRVSKELAPDLLPARLHSSVGRTSHRYRGSHGFESRWSLRIFYGLYLLLKLLHNWEDLFHSLFYILLVLLVGYY